MKRREFMSMTALTPLLAISPRGWTATNDKVSDWRTYELTYDVDVSDLKGAGHLWLPLPQHVGDYQHVLSVGWQGDAQARLDWDDVYRAPIFHAWWQPNEAGRQVKVVARVATRDRSMPAVSPRLRDAQDAALYLQPTENMPIDGIVAQTAQRIVKGIASPDDKARAIYEWIVDNTFRNPKTRGCGRGDIRFMLETGDLGGKCADINSLFVGLARASGIPAREFYGVRVDESALFKTLGKSEDVSQAQHCRAEFFSSRRGWVAVDPADVRKVVLEEKLALSDPKVIALRKRLFGSWEMNWVGFNYARDFALPGRSGESLPYLMYPYAEFGDMLRDGRDPADFKFRLSSRKLSAA
ncbi:MAG: transglutaminase domain-containing protein [Thiobacillus sp.]|nr:transglutaminase domain-containing protein [Thiobacillus sp.]